MNHEPPQHLDQAAIAKWQEIIVILETRGDLDQGTLDALSCYCSAWSRWTAAEQQVNALGPIVKSPTGFPVANPYVAIAAAAQRQMRQWGGELRLTPKARGRKAEAVEESAVA
ncbi:MAG: phage terminase small subunit P27 family, partial [Pirellulaceae bacterium]|nr:phage terminase small subunit P27 family [Pirellulaceae bacterium]